MPGPELQAVLQEWTAGVMRILHLELARRRIGISGQLERQLQAKVYSRGAAEIAEIQMPFRGRFVDMGAGSGQTARQARVSRQTARRRKPWYNKNIYGALNSLQGAIGLELLDAVSEQINQ